MSIPLDRLYHYIESVASEIRKGDVVIYHFYPYGSRKTEDLFTTTNSVLTWMTSPHIYCNDQEPLNFNLYHNQSIATKTSYRDNISHDLSLELVQLDERHKNNIDRKSTRLNSSH